MTHSLCPILAYVRHHQAEEPALDAPDLFIEKPKPAKQEAML